jgi:iron complex outermembrane receptor protein
MISFSRSVSVAICLTLARAATAQPEVLADGSPLELDAFAVTRERQTQFALPLEAAPSTASHLGLAHRDLPASIAIVTQEVMQLRGFRTAVEAIEGAAGMVGGTQYGSIPSYSTRGFTGNSITVLRDGLRQNTASQSARTLDSFNLDRVEILKGPASLLFGEGAIGGAVNYISKPPDRLTRGEVLVSHGARNHTRIGLGVGGPVVADKIFFRTDVSHTQRDGYVERNHERYTSVNGALGWQPNDHWKLTLFTAYLEDRNESYYGNPVLYDAVDRTDPLTGLTTRLVARANTATDALVNPRVDPTARRTNYNILDNYAETENSFHRLRADWTPTHDWQLTNETYATTQLLRWRNVESNLWNPITQLVDRSAFTHIYRDDFLLGNRLSVLRKSELFGRSNRFVLGGVWERNALIRGGTPEGYATTLSSVTLLNPDVGRGPGDATRFQKSSRVHIDTAALYLENAIDLTAALKFVTGLRHDRIAITRRTFPTSANPTPLRFEKNYAPTTGRAGFVWSAHDDVNLYASFSRAAEPVTQLVSLSSAQHDFSLQTGHQFEVGAKGSFAAGKFDFTLALFELEKNDLLSATLDPDTGLRISQQIGAQRSQGTELSLTWLPTRDWRVEFNFAWTWTAEFKDFNESVGTGFISRDGNRPANVPEFVANFHLSKQLGRAWRLGGGPRYVSERAAHNANLIWSPAYTAVDASLTYTHHTWSLTLHARNILDESYEEWATGLMRRLADPRNVELSARYHF